MTASSAQRPQESSLTAAVQLAPSAANGLAQSEVPDFEQVFAEHAPYVLRVLPRLGVQPADVDDVAQEVFLAVHLGLAKFEGRSRLRTWVYGICIRVAGNYRRKAHRKRERAVDAPEPHSDPSAGPEERAGARRALATLDAALERLPAEQREVFVLFEIEGLDMREVASALSCSKFTAYARLYAARKRVLAAVERERTGDES